MTVTPKEALKNVSMTTSKKLSKMAFKSLVSAVSEHCQEIRQTLSSISYFDTWDESAIAESCRLSSLEEFPPKEVILGSGTGNSHTVYFILDGVCRMMHYLQVEMKRDSKGEVKYSLYKSVGENQNSELGSVEYASLLFNEKHEFQGEKRIQQDNKVKETKPEMEEKDELPELDIDRETKLDTSNIAGDKQTKNSSDQNEEKKEITYEEDHPMKVLHQCRKKLQDIIRVNRKDVTHERHKNVNGYFIQTGFLYKGACFGLKKYTAKDFIMSETKVKCLKIPHRFLLQHNPCNIWNRILLFDSLYQPTEEKILECFQIDRKWLKGKKKLTEEIVSRKAIPNYTSISDVPYSLRLTELQ